MNNGTATALETHWNIPPNPNLLIIEELDPKGRVHESRTADGTKEHRWRFLVPIKGQGNVHCKSPSTKFVLAGGMKGIFVRIELIKGADPIKEIREISYTGNLRRAAISDCGKIVALHTTDRARPLQILDIDSDDSIARPQVPAGRVYHTLKLSQWRLEAFYTNEKSKKNEVDIYYFNFPTA